MKIISKFDYSRVLYSKQNNLNLLIQSIAPKVILKEGSRKPLNIITAIDTSTSMGGPKIDYAKKSLLKLIDHLSPNDTLGIISFSSDVRVVSKPMKMTSENKEKFKTEVKSLYAHASTNFSGALFKAMEFSEEVDGDCRIIMFTDGQANQGVTDYKLLVGMLDGKLKKGVTITNFGYGDDHVAEFLTELSKAANGNYAYIKNPDDALTAFAAELGGLLSCYAQDLVFHVKPKGDVKIKEVVSDLDVEELADGGVDISINDIYSEETKNIVLELEVPEQKKFFPRETTLVDVTVSYIDVATGDKTKVESKGRVKFVSVAGEAQTEVDKDVADQLAIAKLVKAQIEATKFAKSGNFAAARTTMQGIQGLVSQASVGTQGIYGTASAYYSDSFSFASNANHAHSLNSALRSGRGMNTGVQGMSGSSGVIGTNSVQMDMMNAFNDQSGAGQGNAGSAGGTVQGNAGQQGIQNLGGASSGISGQTVIDSGHGAIASVTTTNVDVSSTTENKKQLNKKRSQKEW